VTDAGAGAIIRFGSINTKGNRNIISFFYVLKFTIIFVKIIRQILTVQAKTWNQIEETRTKPPI